MDKKYKLHIAESKTKYHRDQAQMPYEEKFKIILELQKINAEFAKINRSRANSNKYIKIWQPE
ncbi:MAG TPA: hypothetical protein PL018_15255 [Ignavibacteriaceae bacterium]|nr:hypothetical protein [Ignavibacteriaceae bacterium]